MFDLLLTVICVVIWSGLYAGCCGQDIRSYPQYVLVCSADFVPLLFLLTALFLFVCLLVGPPASVVTTIETPRTIEQPLSWRGTITLSGGQTLTSSTLSMLPDAVLNGTGKISGSTTCQLRCTIGSAGSPIESANFYVDGGSGATLYGAVTTNGLTFGTGETVTVSSGMSISGTGLLALSSVKTTFQGPNTQITIANIGMC